MSRTKCCRYAIIASLVVLAACDTTESDEAQPTSDETTSTLRDADVSPSQPEESVDITIDGGRESLSRTVIVDISDYERSISSGTSSLPLVIASLSFPDGVTIFEGRLTRIPLALPGCDLANSVV